VDFRFSLSKNLLGRTFLTIYDRFSTFVGGSVVIQGSYNTTNVGDFAIGQIIKKKILEVGFHGHLNGLVHKNQGPIPNFRRYKLHVVGGGGVIRDLPDGYLERRLLPIRKNSSVVIGVGVMNILTESGKKLLKKLEDAIFITVRDTESKEILEKNIETEILKTADPAFLMELRTMADPGLPRSRIKVGLNLREMIPRKYQGRIFYPDELRYEILKLNYFRYIDLIRQEITKHYGEKDFYFIPFSTKDISFAKTYLAGLPINILPLQPPDKTLHTISRMNNMICTRYHSLIFSLIAEVPMSIIAYHQKVLSLAKEINGVQIMSINENPANLPSCINFNVPHSSIASCKSKKIGQAKENFYVLQDVMEHISK